MASAIEFTLNGRRVRLADCSPNITLLEFLRVRGLTGSKEGCAEGDCGACSVAIVERDARGRPCYRAINSCLVPVCLMAGREIVSVEGVACRDKLHPVQQQMVEGDVVPESHHSGIAVRDIILSLKRSLTALSSCSSSGTLSRP